jgi:hypothetical protein
MHYSLSRLSRTVLRLPNEIARQLRQTVTLLTAVSIALQLGVASAFAAKPTTAPVFSLQSEYVQNSSNASAPAWCLNEDDFHQRTWSGALSGTFSVSEQLCNPSVDYSGGMYWGAGGVGLQADLYVVGALTAMSITSPQGVTHSAVLVGSQYLAKQHVTQNHYQVCFTPTYSLSTDIGGTPLPGGTWTIALAGNFSQTSYTETAIMADVKYQQQYCPSSEQSYSP